MVYLVVYDDYFNSSFSDIDSVSFSTSTGDNCSALFANRDEYTSVVSMTVTSDDGADTITDITVSANVVSTAFSTDDSYITAIKLYKNSSDDCGTSTELQQQTSLSAASTSFSFSLSDSSPTNTYYYYYTLAVSVGENADVGDTFDITIQTITGDTTYTPSQDYTIEVTGVDLTFTDVDGSDSIAIFDYETSYQSVTTPGVLVAQFVASPNSDDDFLLDTVVIYNSESNFSSDVIEGVRVIAENQVLGSVVTGNTNFSADTVTVSVSYELDASENIYVYYDISDDFDLIDDDGNFVTVNAQLLEFSGAGEVSGLDIEQLDITTQTNNTSGSSIGLAGITITNVENLISTEFANSVIGAGISDIPILKFNVVGVRVDGWLSNLYIDNSDSTFISSLGRTNGITNLTWYRDDGNGDFDGIQYETLIDDTSDSSDILSKSLFGFEQRTSSGDAAVSAASSYRNDELDSTTFYILADFGVGMSAGDTVSVNVSDSTLAYFDDGTVTAQVSIGSDLPLDVTDNQLTLVDPAFRIQTSMTDGSALFNDGGDGISDASERYTLVAGMYDLVLYVVSVDAIEDITELSLEFESPQSYFASDGSGISKLAVFWDKDLDSAFSDEDVYLSSTTTFSGSTVTLSDISMPEGSYSSMQQLLVMFDLGQTLTSSSGNVSIRLTNASISDKNVVGFFPNPIVPPTYNVNAHLIQIESISSTISSDDDEITEDSTFDVEIVVEDTGVATLNLVQNDDSEPLTIPKFYLSNASGADHSYEFVSTFDSDNSSTSWTDTMSGVTINLQYSVSAANLLTNGNYLIDSDVYYNVDTDDAGNFLEDTSIRLTRSLGSGSNFTSALDISDGTGTALQPYADTDNDSYSWTLPDLVASVSVLVNTEYVDFYNYQSVPQNAKMQIAFDDDGLNVDVESLSLTLNGDSIDSESEYVSGSGSNYYTYDDVNGIIEVQSVGDTSGQIVISANDSVGNAYPDMPLIFYTSDALEINQFLVYPNPFSPSLQGSSGITIGFSITDVATIVIYIFDSAGRQVSVTESTSYSVGYHTISWDAIIDQTGYYMASGTYFLKIIATDVDGNVVTETAKLAVY